VVGGSKRRGKRREKLTMEGLRRTMEKKKFTYRRWKKIKQTSEKRNDRWGGEETNTSLSVGKIRTKANMTRPNGEFKNKLGGAPHNLCDRLDSGKLLKGEKYALNLFIDRWNTVKEGGRRGLKFGKEEPQKGTIKNDMI